MSRQRIAHRRPVQPTALQRQVRPAQTGRGLGADQQIDAAAPGIEVDQQRIGGGLRQRGREQRRTRAAAPADHGRHRAPGHRRRARIRRPRRARGPVHVPARASSAHAGHRRRWRRPRLPVGRPCQSRARHDYVDAARQIPPCRTCPRGAPRRARPPRPPTTSSGSPVAVAAGVDDPDTDRCRDPIQLVAQVAGIGIRAASTPAHVDRHRPTVRWQGRRAAEICERDLWTTIRRLWIIAPAQRT